MSKILELTIPAGKDIKEAIVEFVVEQQLTRSIIIGGIGSAKNLEIAAPISPELPLKTTPTLYPVAAEILSFSGEILPWEEVDSLIKNQYSQSTDPVFVHIHVSAAFAGGLVFGGGLRGGNAFRALRIFMIRL